MPIRRAHGIFRRATGPAGVIAAGVLLIVALAACSSEAGPGPAKPLATQMHATSDVNQDGIVGRIVHSNPAVIVLDRNGQPVSGAKVVFSTNTTSAARITTADGTASSAWILGTLAGTQSFVATLAGSSVPSVTFTAIAAADTAAAIVSAAPLLQAGLASAPVSSPPSVVVVDAFHNAKPGVEVTFEVTGGAGSVAPAKVVTDAKGIAAVGSWTLGQAPGNNVLTAHALHLAPVSFTALANAPFFASTVVSGLYHTCAIAQDGDTYCWGLNDRHQVSDDARGSIRIPQRVPSAHRFVSLAPGGFHTCSISDEVPARAYCWGENGFGQTGSGSWESVLTAPALVPVSGGLTMVVTGIVHSCGLNPAGEAFCWGAGSLGQLGDGAITSHSRPVRVSATLRFTSLAAGASHTCGLTVDGQMYCWGYNDHNQLGVATPATCAGDGYYYGYGYNVPSYVPCATTPQLIPNVRFVAISAGYGTCGLTEGGEVECSGFNSGMVPVSKEFRFARLAPDGRCGFGVDGVAYCWSTTEGLLNAPVLSETGSTPRSIAHGREHTCGVLASDGSVVCLGRNEYGQLGNGTTTASSVPLPVARPANP